MIKHKFDSLKFLFWYNSLTSFLLKTSLQSDLLLAKLKILKIKIKEKSISNISLKFVKYEGKSSMFYIKITYIILSESSHAASFFLSIPKIEHIRLRTNLFLRCL